MAPTPPTSPPSTNRAQSSPAKFKEHYSHLTYAVRRTKEDDDGTPTSPSSKKKQQQYQSREEANLAAALSLPPLKLISGFAISEDGFLMSRFVSPPRFGLNNIEEANEASGGASMVSPIRTAASAKKNSNNSPGSQRVFTATVSRDVHGNARISIPATSNNVGGMKNNHNNNGKNDDGMINAHRALFFTTGYTPVVAGNDEKNKNKNKNGKTPTKRGAKGKNGEHEEAEEVQLPTREGILLELAGNDPWQLVLLANQEHGTGLGEEELGMLEWATVKNVVAQLNISFLVESPIHRAKTELGWRKIHDQILLNEVKKNKPNNNNSNANVEGNNNNALLSSTSRSFSGRFGNSSVGGGGRTGAAGIDDTTSVKSEPRQTQSQLQPSIFSMSEEKQLAGEFQNFVEQLYPPSPIIQAAGGPVILVRTAPQGEILVNPTSLDENSPRRRKNMTSSNKTSRTITTTAEYYSAMNHNSNNDQADIDEPCVHYRKIPEDPLKHQFGQTVESSPLKRPALVKQIPKQF